MQKQPHPGYYIDTTPAPFPKDFPIIIVPDDIVRDTQEHPMHVHDFLEIGLCHEGTGAFMINKKLLSYQKGDAVIINSREAHRAHSRKETTSLWTWVYIDVAGLLSNFTMDFQLLDYSPFWGEHFTNVISPENDPVLRDAVRQIVEEVHTNGTKYKQVIRAQVLYLMALLHRAGKSIERTSTETDTSPSLHRVAPALAQISSQYNDKIDIRGLARLCNMSVPHFRRIFQKATGKNPLEYLMNLRLTMACLEMTSTNKSAEKIAADCGFPTFSCFLRKFKTVYGMTPHKWRRQ